MAKQERTTITVSKRTAKRVRQLMSEVHTCTLEGAILLGISTVLTLRDELKHGVTLMRRLPDGSIEAYLLPEIDPAVVNRYDPAEGEVVKV